VGSPRKRLNEWGRSEGGAAVFTGGRGAPAIGRGQLKLLQHRTQRGGEERRTRGGGAHREAAAATMVTRQAARSSHGVGTGTDGRSKARGGMARGALRGKNGGEDEMGRGGVGWRPF
jgi:hypothetical protein